MKNTKNCDKLGVFRGFCVRMGQMTHNGVLLLSLLLICVHICCNVLRLSRTNTAIINQEGIMIFVVYLTECVVCFVCHELSKVLDYVGTNSFCKIEIWSDGRKAGGYRR